MSNWAIWAAWFVGLAMAYFFRSSRRNYLELPELPAIDDAEPSQDVIVIIPARNEERHIARAISSFPRGWVLVVDDESSDRTADVARENTAEVIPAAKLAANQKGKPNACATGAKATGSEWILFVDADTWYAPEFLRSVLEYAENERLDLVTVFPRQELRTLTEKALLPLAFALYFCGVNAAAVNDPKSPEALANGRCMLFRRSFYDFMGGHAGVAHSAAEDIDLALLAKRHRGRVRAMRAEHVAFTRMYPRLGDFWGAFSRCARRILEDNPRARRNVVAAGILTASWLPVALWLARAEAWIPLAVFAVVPVLVLAPWYGGVLAGLFAPVAVGVFPVVALNALLDWLTGRKTMWKGRAV